MTGKVFGRSTSFVLSFASFSRLFLNRVPSSLPVFDRDPFTVFEAVAAPELLAAGKELRRSLGLGGPSLPFRIDSAARLLEATPLDVAELPLDSLLDDWILLRRLVYR